MSFNLDIKKQYMAVEEKSKKCKGAEFYAVYMMTGGTLKTANRDLATRMVHLCQRAGGVPEQLSYRSGARPQYLVITRWSGTFLLENENAATAFLRGCFLIGGYVADPSKPAHLEIVFKEQDCYEMCMAAFELAGIFVKGTLRENRYVLYIKDSDEIIAFFVKTGAVRGALEYENARIMKQCNTASNRVINCDDANINKAIEAGFRQKGMLEKFMATDAFQTLPSALQETARLRVENPGISLTELGQMMKPPMSKAGVAHRLKKIETMIATGQIP